ncbi:MAG: biotin--[acetyl-CoA-carboxylase] ligase [Acidobacteria bacterium SCN 69-37]|nr:MAG: biotin--[acetyl-CoA-carboxylase] ligase [Acidobacteria bacterium SCN 69-37]
MSFEPLPDDLAAALAANASSLGAFADVRYVAEVDSTNDVALALAAAGASEGTSVLADHQRRGRGRRGHEWFSPPGAGLYLSVIVRPDMPRGTSLLTLAAGMAMAEAVLGDTGLPVELKWPNDLVIGRPWRKLGGVLAETVSAGGRSDAVIIGLGLNVRHVVLPPDLAHRASSLETELGREIDRANLAVGLLDQLRGAMHLLRHDLRDAVIARWRGLARAGLGGMVRWTDTTGERQGRAMDIDGEGALIVQTSAGVERVIAGDVIWEAPIGG